MNTDVLNPRLYLRLVRAFKSVGIHRQREPMQAVKPSGMSWRLRKARLDVLDWGEAYRVNCFYCGDSRQRLYINHKWDEDHRTYRRFLRCFNEECQQCRDFLPELISKLGSAPTIGMGAPEPISAPKGPQALQLPGECIPVHKLKGSHPAVRYLDSRGFDVYELGTQWDVSWCDYSVILPRNNRLFVPFYDLDAEGNRILVGGQARWLDIKTGKSVPPSDSKQPKWFTLKGTRPSQTLFNSWRAGQQSQLVVVVEGPFDAMRLKPDIGVALFGHAISYTHREQLWKYWGKKGGVCVLWLDPDMDNDKVVAQYEQQLRQQWGDNLIRIKTGGTRDVGDMTQKEAHSIIEEAVRDHQETKEKTG